MRTCKDFKIHISKNMFKRTLVLNFQCQSLFIQSANEFYIDVTKHQLQLFPDVWQLVWALFASCAPLLIIWECSGYNLLPVKASPNYSCDIGNNCNYSVATQLLTSIWPCHGPWTYKFDSRRHTHCSGMFTSNEWGLVFHIDLIHNYIN